MVLLHTTGHQPTIVFCLQFMGVLVSETVCQTRQESLSQPTKSWCALLGTTDGFWLPLSLAGVHCPTAFTLMPVLDALEWNGSCLCSQDLWHGVGCEGSKWSPLSGRHCKLHYFIGFVKVFSILLTLFAVTVDFVHELGIRGDLVVPCFTDLQTHAEVTWSEVGKYVFSNQGQSSFI